MLPALFLCFLIVTCSRGVAVNLPDKFQPFHISNLILSSNLLGDNAGSRCGIELTEIYSGIQNGFPWALKFADSWGKIPSGILWGHLYELGSFDECLDINHKFTYNGVVDYIQGKYCMTNFNLASSFKNDSEHITKELQLKIGICIPRSCDTEYVNEIAKHNLFRTFNVTLAVDATLEDKCVDSKVIEFDLVDWIAIGVIFSIAVLVTLSSGYEVLSRAKTHNKLLKSFSLINNTQLLFRTTTTKSSHVIDCLHGIRCLSTIWIVFVHSYMISLMLPSVNEVEKAEWHRTVFSMFQQSGSIAVDSFFFLSGLLIVWTALQEMERNCGRLNVIKMYLHRYIRLTPVLAMAVLFFDSLYRHIGNGPLWETFTGSFKFCNDNWWTTLLYIQNYASAGKMCLGHSWYLAVDMQLYFLSPILVISLFKWRRKAVAGIIVLGLLLIACIFTTIILNNYSVFSIIGNLGTDNNEMREIYYSTHSRTSPWLVGILFGYYLYNRKSRRARIPVIIVVVGWLVSFTLLAIGIFSLYPKTLPTSKPLTVYEGAAYLTLSRVVWPLALSWIVFACVNGYGSIINNFLSWTFWQPMSRLSYCLYINHLIIILINGGRTKVDIHFSDYDMILRFWGDFGISLFVSVLTYITLESPMAIVERELFSGRKPRSTATTTTSTKNLCDENL